MRKKVSLANLESIRCQGESILGQEDGTRHASGKLRLVEIRDAVLRSMFDEALDLTHYAKSCQRVGRCMSLQSKMQSSESSGGNLRL